ncbi:hypothetical protein ABZ725_24935 [Streptomyces sp. NPDC006872]|uniref:hypothetical protein n=1 Tax=Streptomyces sp. NPDC006872 TaxID=3155720 RepID=UPI00340B5B6D
MSVAAAHQADGPVSGPAAPVGGARTAPGRHRHRRGRGHPGPRPQPPHPGATITTARPDGASAIHGGIALALRDVFSEQGIARMPVDDRKG